MKSVNACMSASVELAVAADQAREGEVELLERGVLVERVAARIVAAGAVAAPVHRAVVRHAAQALRRHRPLQRMEVLERAAERRMRNGIGLLSDVVVGIAEVPGRLSKSPKMWQLAHDASPLLDVRTAS